METKKTQSAIIMEARLEHILAISEFTRGENLRYRPPEEIGSQRSNFLVAVNGKNEVVGCVGSKLYESDAEIISLRLAEDFREQGLGKRLLERKIQELKKWPNLNIFALVTEEAANKLFFPLGFIRVGIQLFGPKVLIDCVGCSRNRMAEGTHLCNEIAVLYQR